MADWAKVVELSRPNIYIPMDEGSGTLAKDDIGGSHMTGYNTPLFSASSLVDDLSYSIDFRQAQSEYGLANGFSEMIAEHPAGDPLSVEIWFETTRTGHTSIENQIFSCHDGSTNRFTCCCTTAGAILSSGYYSTTTGLNDGNPHLLSFYWPDSTTRASLWIDGVQDATDGPVFNRTSTSWAFGMEYDSGPTPGDYFDGRLQAFLGWRRQITTAEILQRYKIGTTAASPPTLSGTGNVNGSDVYIFNSDWDYIGTTTVTTGTWSFSSWLLISGEDYYVVNTDTGYRPIMHGPVNPV